MRNKLVALASLAALILSIAAFWKTWTQPKPVAYGDPQVDSALRTLSGFHSLFVPLQTPPEDLPFGVYEVFEFVDGKKSRNGYSSLFLRKDGTLRLEVLWGKTNGRNHMAYNLIRPDGSVSLNSISFRDDKQWEHPCGKTILGPNAPLQEFEGMQVVAWAYSNSRMDGSEVLHIDDDFLQSVEKRKYVVAIGVKYFATAEEAMRFSENLQRTP